MMLVTIVITNVLNNLTVTLTFEQQGAAQICANFSLRHCDLRVKQ
jgi:hypothetical protein